MKKETRGRENFVTVGSTVGRRKEGSARAKALLHDSR